MNTCCRDFRDSYGIKSHLFRPFFFSLDGTVTNIPITARGEGAENFNLNDKSGKIEGVLLN